MAEYNRAYGAQHETADACDDAAGAGSYEFLRNADSGVEAPYDVPRDRPRPSRRPSQSMEMEEPAAGNALGREKTSEQPRDGEAATGEPVGADAAGGIISRLEAEVKSLTGELEKSRREYEAMKKKWKKTGRELNLIQASQQKFDQPPDSHVIEMVQGLRADIRGLAIQFFTGEPGRPPQSLPPSLAELAAQDASLYARSAACCPWLVEAYIWSILGYEIFGRFVWAGEVGSAIAHLKSFLPRYHSSVRHSISAALADKERNHQMWSVKTITLMTDGLDEEESCAMKWQADIVDRIQDEAHHLLQPLARCPLDDGFEKQISNIVMSALDLDRTFSFSLSRYVWHGPSLKRCPLPVDLGAMAIMSSGAKWNATATDVQLVIAPGLHVLGSSTGAGFEGPPRMLLKMLVHCEKF